MVRLIFGIKYGMEDIKNKSSLHYTIYKDFKNIISNTHYISLFDEGLSEECLERKKNSCNLILGTLFPEYMETDEGCSSIILKCIERLQDKKIDTYYLPHPKDDSNFRHDELIVLDGSVAELEVKQLLIKYSKVNLYGFNSSAQYNLMSDDRIVNYVYYLEGSKSVYKDAIRDDVFPNSFKVIEVF